MCRGVPDVICLAVRSGEKPSLLSALVRKNGLYLITLALLFRASPLAMLFGEAGSVSMGSSLFWKSTSWFEADGLALTSFYWDCATS